MRQPLVAGNWKLHGTRSSVVTLASEIADGIRSVALDALICPAFPHLQAVLETLPDESRLRVGAQNCSDQQQGAYTGEVSAQMLADLGVSHVLVGHSERRQLYAESNEQVAIRFEQVQNAGIAPIVCLGETAEQRKAGETFSVVGHQLASVVDRCGIESLAEAVVAYEPVWAIGTGETATAGQAQEVHQWLRRWIAERDPAIARGIRVLYGGSVKPSNAHELFAQPDIDGGLIGGASLDADDFVAICRAAAD